jgi:hypothetical protein
MRSRRISRLARICGISIVGGASSAILSSWFIVLLVPKPGLSRTKSLDGNVQWPVRVPADWPGSAMGRASREMAGWRFGRWQTSDVHDVIITDSGWPVPSLRTIELLSWTATSAMNRRVGFPLPASMAANSERGLLPVVPVWPAFAANVAIHATFWMALGCIVNWSRRQCRARRGCCPDCAYDLAPHMRRCPECGRFLSEP